MVEAESYFTDGEIWRNRNESDCRDADRMRKEGGSSADSQQTEVVAQVRAAADQYERALSENDLEAMDELFWNCPLTVRYGPNGSNYGHESISTYRKGRPKGTRTRIIVKQVVTTFGDDFGTSSFECSYADSSLTGRRMQSWVRTDDGWRQPVTQ